MLKTMTEKKKLQPQEEKRSIWLLNLFKYLSIGYIALTLAATLLSTIYYAYNPNSKLFIMFRSELIPIDFALFAIAIIVGVGLITCVSYLFRTTVGEKLATERRFRVFTCCSLAFLLMLQAFVAYGAYFHTGWDVAALTNFEAPDPDYYSQYPNQLFLAGLFARIAGMGSILGIKSGYACVVVFGCLSVSLSVVLASAVAKKLAGYAAGYCAFILGAILAGLSPWILVPYSDTYGMLWTCLVLYAYVCIERPIIKWPIIGFCSVIGYMIKPTVIFVLCAIIVIEIIFFLKQGRLRQSNANPITKRIRSYAPAMLAFLLACVVALSASSVIKNIGVETDPEKSFSVTHYLMMGTNLESLGGFDPDDVGFSSSFTTSAERQQANMNKWTQRVAEAGPIEMLCLYIKKSIINFADGTFAWTYEGGFFRVTQGNNELIKSIYGIDDTNPAKDRPILFAPIAQILWFMVLIGCILCLLRKQSNKAEIAMFLTLLMLAMFLMVFECRARYLLLYLPYFVVLGILGWREVGIRLLENKRLSG